MVNFMFCGVFYHKKKNPAIALINSDAKILDKILANIMYKKDF